MRCNAYRQRQRPPCSGRASGLAEIADRGRAPPHDEGVVRIHDCDLRLRFVSKPLDRLISESAYRGETVTRIGCTAHDVGADARETDCLIRAEQAADAPGGKFADAVARYNMAGGDGVREQRPGSKGLCDTQYLCRPVG